MAKLTFEEIIKLSPKHNSSTNFRKRYVSKKNERRQTSSSPRVFVSLMQGYDSAAMDIDVEVCGTDQTFNALIGRNSIEKLKGKEKFVVAITLMENPKTGELMSKSKGNGVFLGGST